MQQGLDANIKVRLWIGKQISFLRLLIRIIDRLRAMLSPK